MGSPIILSGTNIASTTLSTANTLATVDGASGSVISSLVGTNTGYGELYAQANTGSWAASGSIGSPSGHGWLLDTTLLEGGQLLSGSWTPTISMKVSVGSVIADLYVRAYKRSSGGVYTLIGTMSKTGNSIGTSISIFTFATSTLSSMSFASGDKIYLDVWANVTSNSTSSSTATLSIVTANSAGPGDFTYFQIVTAGYIPGNGGTATGGTTGNTYQLATLDYSTVQYYETWEGLSSGGSGKTTLPNAPSGQAYAVTFSGASGFFESIASSGAEGYVLENTNNGTADFAIGNLSTYLTGEAFFLFRNVAPTSGGSNGISTFFLTSNIYIRCNTSNNNIVLVSIGGTNTTLLTLTNGSTYNIGLRLKWVTSGSTTTIYAGASSSANTVSPSVPTTSLIGTATALTAIAPIVELTGQSNYHPWGGAAAISGTTFQIAGQINVPSVTTSSRTTPATMPVKSVGLNRSSAATFVLKTLAARRASPATMLVKSVALQRASPAVMPLAFRVNRTTPATIPLRGTFYRVTVAALVLKSLGNQRTSPATMLLASLGQRRATPATLLLAFRSYRSTIASLVLKKSGIARATPASMVLVWGPRPVQIIKQQYVKVFKNDGTFICCWNDAAIMGDSGTDAPKFAVNAITNQINITLPRLFDNFDEAGDRRGRGSVGAGNIVQIWVVDNDQIPYGRLVFQGVIDGYQPQFDTSNNESMQVLVTPFDSVLGDVKFFGTQTFGITADPQTYVDPVAMFDWPFENINQVTGQPYPYPLTLDPANPTSSGVGYSLQWSKQSITDWNEDVRTVAPQNWFWRTNHDTKTVTFTQAPTTPKHTFIVGKHLVAPQYQMTYQPLKNYVWVQGTACLAIAQGADILQFGQRTLTIVEPRIFDQYTCNRYANGTLASVDVPAFRSTITVVDYRGDVARLANISHPATLWDTAVWDVDSWDYPTSAQLGQSAGLGYDIDRIQVGDVCQVLDPTYNYLETLWDSAIWDTDSWDYPTTGILGQAIVIVGLTYKFFTVDLELAVLQPSQDRFLVDLANQLEASQLG